jgi:hypothetical protein
MKAPLVFERMFDAVGAKFHRKRNKDRLHVWRDVLNPDGEYFFPFGLITLCVVIFTVVTLAVNLVTGGAIFAPPASRDQITSAYRDILHREPDQAGIDGYDKSDLSDKMVRKDLEASQEKSNLDKAQKHD